MMAPDTFRFLESWTQLLPRAGGAVVALAGSGGCTTLLLRVIEALRAVSSAHPRVLVTQTTDHPVPLSHREGLLEVAGGRLDPTVDVSAWERGPVRWAAGEVLAPASDRRAGLDVATIESLRRALQPDVVLVQAHASCGTPLRRDAIAPVWPSHLHLALLVSPLSVVGRLWDARTVAGSGPHSDTRGEPRRVTSADVLESMRDLVAAVPPVARPLPFLTGFGSYRDLDGMFALVQELWDPPRVPVVCLGELLGDERRDAADLAGLDAAARAGALEGERVYAVYPAALDDVGEESG